MTCLSGCFISTRCGTLLPQPGGTDLLMIEVANILLCGLQPKVMRCITHLQPHFCSIHDDPPWTIRDARMPYQDSAMPDGDAFRVLLAEMATSACLKRHPPAGKQVIFCRPARRNLWCRFGGGRGFRRDNIGPQVCTAPLPKPGPKAQQQIVPNL